MTYPYGMQGMPKVGNGLGGLPRRPEAGQGLSNFNPQILYFTTGTSVPQFFEVLKGLYSFFRVTVVGGGGGGGVFSIPNGLYRGGGGGGGLSMSAIMPVLRNTMIEYGVGFGGSGGLTSNIQDGANGGDSYAKFPGADLLGGGGRGGTLNAGGLGGIATGGVENHPGGRSIATNSRAFSGGGAGGVFHSGDDGGVFTDNTGGGGGAGVNINSGGPGGGGSGAKGGSVVQQPGSSSSTGAPSYAPAKMNRGFAAIGFQGADSYQVTSSAASDGGVGGGGGGGGSSGNDFGGNGGVGIVRIELW